MKSHLICSVLAAAAQGASLEKTRSAWLEANDPWGVGTYQQLPNVIGAPVEVPEPKYTVAPVPEVVIEDVEVPEVVVEDVYVPEVAPLPIVDTRNDDLELETSEPEEPAVEVVHEPYYPTETEVIVNDVEEVVAVVEPEPEVVVAPSQEVSDYVEAADPIPAEPEPTPEPPVFEPPAAPEKPSASPSWLSSWMDELSTAPAPDIPRPTVTVAEVKPKPAYGIQTSYTRKWGKTEVTKPKVPAYKTPVYKPVVYTPKKYTPKVVSYTRPEPKVVEEKVEKKVEEKKPAEKRTYSSYDSDDSRYLRTYRNRYSGTKAKPHSHMSCLQRMLSRFSRYNREIRTRRQTRNSSLSGRK